MLPDYILNNTPTRVNYTVWIGPDDLQPTNLTDLIYDQTDFNLRNPKPPKLYSESFYRHSRQDTEEWVRELKAFYQEQKNFSE